MIESELLLFLGFLLALFVLIYFSKRSLLFILKERKERVLNKTLALKRDLKFVELDRKKAFYEYQKNKEKNEDWQQEAQNSYIFFYDSKQAAYDLNVATALQKRALTLKSKAREKKLQMVNDVIELILTEIQSQNLHIEVDYQKLISKVVN